MGIQRRKNKQTQGMLNYNDYSTSFKRKQCEHSFPEAPADSCTAERKVYFCPGQISNFSFLLRLLSLPPFFPRLIHIFLILFHTFKLKICPHSPQSLSLFSYPCHHPALCLPGVLGGVSAPKHPHELCSP